MDLTPTIVLHAPSADLSPEEQAGTALSVSRAPSPGAGQGSVPELSTGRPGPPGEWGVAQGAARDPRVPPTAGVPQGADSLVEASVSTPIPDGSSAGVRVEDLVRAVREVAPGARVIGFGSDLAVFKGVGNPTELAQRFGLPRAQGWQGVAHTRMATESAVTAEGSHPFSVGPGQCLVHNGSFSNHMSIKHELQRAGIEFDSENDTEVGARFVARQLAQGADLEKSLLLLNDVFDGFYTLLVSTSDSFAVVRDAIACKPAVIAETDRWVAMASEYRALADLPGVEHARIFEPEPEEVYVWRRS
ncbi:glutamine amidotransferase [Nocardia jejuensis]|uniref:glutamine amidotransferase n=1 Tax=Nocardia jejuensis TaxID=328049 RepID=UPI0012F84C4A